MNDATPTCGWNESAPPKPESEVTNDVEKLTDLWMDIQAVIAKSRVTRVDAMAVLELMLFTMKKNMVGVLEEAQQ